MKERSLYPKEVQMNRYLTLIVVGSFFFFSSVTPLAAELLEVDPPKGSGGGGEIQTVSNPSKDLGIDYPDAILLAGGVGRRAPFQGAQGDIDGNGIPDLIFIAGQGNRQIHIFFDATLSSIRNRAFADADFYIVTQKISPWAGDVVKYHPMHWLVVADLNQDGFDDIVFGLPVIDLGGGLRDEKGEVYVVLGNTRANLGTRWDFSVKPPSFTFFGKDPGDRAGWSVATGDINGDGRKDLLIGAPHADGPNNAFPEGGEIYGITHMDWSKSSIVLTKSNVNLYIYGETGQKYGYAITTGNLNGDVDPETNYPVYDIIVAPYVSGQGPVKVIFGKTSERRLLSDANWVSAYGLIPRHPNLTTGDMNHDGIDDLVAADAGERIFITYGSRNNISTSADTRVNPRVNALFGFSNFIADFDGDGLKDLAILAPRFYGLSRQYTLPVGEADIVWGEAARLPSTINLATEPTHFTLYGSDGTGPTGLSSGFQGAWNSTYGYVFGMDLDGDNISELFFGASPYSNAYIYTIGPGRGE